MQFKMHFRAYYYTLTPKQRKQLKNSILKTLDISSHIFYRWLSGQTKVPKAAQIVIQLIAKQELEFDLPSQNS